MDHFPFVGKFFPVTVYLANEVRDQAGKSIRFSLSLYAGESADQLSPVENGIEVDEQSRLEIPCVAGNCNTIVSIKILKPSGVSLFNARKFFLVAQPLSCEHFRSISSGYSDPLVAVNYRLVITNGHELPAIFYNATKGKGNKMEIKVRLLDSNGNAVTDRPNLKLNVVLHYEDNTTVDQSQKKMLEISSDSKLFIGDTGETRIRFRIINAVSRKHGNKRFKVSVSADCVHNAARYNDVSFDYSPSIDVRTKVDEKARERRMAKKAGTSNTGANISVLHNAPTLDATTVISPSIANQVRPRSILKADGQVDPAPNLKRVRTEERPLALESYVCQAQASTFPTLSGSLSLISEAVPPSFVKYLAQDIIDKAESLRWKKVGDLANKEAGDVVGDDAGVYNGYEVSNPNKIIDEIISTAKNFLHGQDTTFDHVASNVAPAPSRNHSLALGNQPL